MMLLAQTNGCFQGIRKVIVGFAASLKSQDLVYGGLSVGQRPKGITKNQLPIKKNTCERGFNSDMLIHRPLFMGHGIVKNVVFLGFSLKKRVKNHLLSSCSVVVVERVPASFPDGLYQAIVPSNGLRYLTFSAKEVQDHVPRPAYAHQSKSFVVSFFFVTQIPIAYRKFGYD